MVIFCKESTVKKRVSGFTLPTVLVSSLLLMSMLLLAMQVSIVSRKSLDDQYYHQLAREAAEAGGEYMGDCISRNYFNTSAPDITPATDCNGVALSPAKSGYLIDSTSDRPFRTTFSSKYVQAGESKAAQTIGKTEIVRPDGTVVNEYTYYSHQQISSEFDSSGSRASKRWWMFGVNARLDFGVSGKVPSAGLPTPGLIGGEASSNRSAEGITVISDRYGNLKFYSDGMTVWDKDGNVVPILSGMKDYTPNCLIPSGVSFKKIAPQNICGSETAVQAIAAFPVNREETRYMIITNTANNSHRASHGNLFASMVDTSTTGYTNNTALRYTNVRLGSGWSTTEYASEALNARPNEARNGAVVYTYGHTNNGLRTTIYAFNVFSQDNGSHLTSGAPATYTYNHASGTQPICSGNNNDTAFGSINFNKDYTKMLVLIGGHACSGSDSKRNQGKLLLFDVSGGDTSMRLLADWSVDGQASADDAKGYSADFSPGGDYVYVATIYPGELYRYNISSQNSTTIKNSERFIGYTNCRLITSRPCDPAYNRNYTDWLGRYSDGGGQVLRGPDDRMYVANRASRYISYINNPDAPNGARLSRPVSPTAVTPTAQNVGWNYGGVALPVGALSMYGLPQMVSLYSPRLWHY